MKTPKHYKTFKSEINAIDKFLNLLNKPTGRPFKVEVFSHSDKGNFFASYGKQPIGNQFKNIK